MNEVLDVLIDKCGNLYDSHTKAGDILISKNKWNVGDPRLGMVYVTGNIILDHLVHLNLIRSSLLSKEWWVKNMKIESHEVIQHGADAYTVSTKAGLFFVFAGRFEAYIRKIDSALEQKDNSVDKFIVVYTRLFTRVGLSEEIGFLNLLSKIRNLIHTDGVYNKADVDFEFRDKKFFFKKGSNIDFLTLDFILDIYSETSQLVMKILETKDVRSIKV